MTELIKIENGVALLNADTSKKLAEFERAVQEIKAKQDELKQSILAEMDKHGILKIDTDDLVISYIAPSTRETFDSKTFRANNPDLYDEYVKISTVSPSVRIKLK